MKSSQLYLSTVDPQAGDLARQYGLGLEIAEFCTAWNLDDEFPAADQAVRREGAGISRFTLHGPYSELYPCAVDRKARALARDRFLQAIRAAALYGADKLILHGGFDPHLYYPIWFREQSILFFRDFIREVPENLTLCLENVLEPEPSYLLDIIRAVDSPRLRLCLDVGHANAYSQASPLNWVCQAGDLISHFHLHNNDGTQDSHSPLPQGTIPMKRLLEKISLSCPHATMTLELPEAASSLVWLREEKILEEEV